MLIQTKIQVDPKDYEFVKKVYKDLRYKSLSEYVREAISAKVKQDRSPTPITIVCSELSSTS